MQDLGADALVLQLVEEVLGHPQAEREAWIREKCRNDRKTCERVLAMLDRCDEAADFLKTGRAPAVFDDRVMPSQIGAYRITGLIGQGGMGAVYRGERMTGDFTHAVAIKVIRPGLLSETLVERFQRERQTLASLSHPNIAQLYDGGDTEAGSPFIVMEYVNGVPLLRWVEQNGPSHDERRRLFCDICAAVAFAHRNLIVHRDLTPTNVLVTQDNVVKLIDFGISRPTDDVPGIADGARNHPAVRLSFTPGYSAPERMTSAEVTTAADIYSLGKLLEKLMPPAPRDTDLRAIIKRAIADDPLARYPTADALRQDVRDWGRSLPVAAVNGGRGYHIRKFILRHRAAVVAASLALLLLVSALVVTILSLDRAETSRRAEAARFAELRSLANYMLFDLNSRLERVVGNSASRVSLADRAQRYMSALAASPDASPDLRLEAAQGFIALAHIQGVPGAPNLDQRDQSRANLMRAVSMLRAADLDQDKAKPLLAQAFASLALIQANIDADLPAAKRSETQAAAALSAVPAKGRGERWMAARSNLRRTQLDLMLLGGKADELLGAALRLEREIAQWPPSLRKSRAAAIDQAYAAHYRGLAAYLAGQYDEGVSAFLAAERLLQALDSAEPNDPAVLYMLAYNGYAGHGTADGLVSRRAEASRFLRTARETVERLSAIDPQDASVRDLAGTLKGAEARALSAAGEYEPAIALQREVVRLRRQAIGSTRRVNALNRLVLAEITLGDIARQARDRALACSSYDTAGRVLAALWHRNEALGFVLAHQENINLNNKSCAAGAPSTQFKKLDGG